MKVLWLCNIMLPKIAQHFQKEVNHKEGWLTGTYDRLSKSQFVLEDGEKIELMVCFPVSRREEEGEIQLDDFFAYGFYEDTGHPEHYDKALESTFLKIVKSFEPDVVHCFGTEYPHTLAMTRAFPYPEKILIGIQGLCFEYAKDYMAMLPEKVQNRRTFRDILKQDSLKQQQKKFVKRGEHEILALKNAGHITGRTTWDRECTKKVCHGEYHFMNETLRSPFYEGKWKKESCEPYSIFVSQGDYSIKGLHFILEAMPEILKKFPDTVLYVAGNDVRKNTSFMKKIKLSAYGSYLNKLINAGNLQGKVHFLGKLSAKEMKERFLKSHLYLCPSIIENSPNSLGEAMLLGMPCVAADVGGISSIFTDKEDGILFEKGNVKALAKSIMQMFSDEKAQKIYGENAREHAKKTHDADANYKRLLEIYGEIVCR